MTTHVSDGRPLLPLVGPHHDARLPDGEHTCCAPSTRATEPARAGTTPPPVPRGARSTRGQVQIPAGTFWMGDSHGDGYAADGELPSHRVRLSSYFVDTKAVTNAQFASFVKATDYVTDAERDGVSAVFHLAVEAAPTDILR